MSIGNISDVPQKVSRIDLIDWRDGYVVNHDTH